MKAFIFKYSTRTGLARLIETSNLSEAEYSAVALDNPPQIWNISGLKRMETGICLLYAENLEDSPISGFMNWF